MSRKTLLTPVLVAVACLLAGLYGIAHDQISYTVSPEYFTSFKFRQFAVPSALPDRFGVAVVGWAATWWMGLIVSVPLVLLALPLARIRDFTGATLQAFIIAIATTLVTGLCGLAGSFVAFPAGSNPAFLHQIVPDTTLSDPAAFARAGTMHNFSYLGGLLGLLSGSLFLARKRRNAPRYPVNEL